MSKETRAVVVCGPTSSGNRWLAGKLIKHAGGFGFDTHRQPHEGGEIPDATSVDKRLILIKHAHLALWSQMLRAHGWQHLTAIMLLREEHASVSSQLKHGHENDFDRAAKSRAVRITDALRDAVVHFDSVRVQTLEGITVPAFNAWLHSCLGIKGKVEAWDAADWDAQGQSLSTTRNLGHYS